MIHRHYIFIIQDYCIIYWLGFLKRILLMLLLEANIESNSNYTFLEYGLKLWTTRRWLNNPAVTGQPDGDCTTRRWLYNPSATLGHILTFVGLNLGAKQNKIKQQINRKQSICWRVWLFWNPWRSVANSAVTGQPGGDWTSGLDNPAVVGQPGVDWTTPLRLDNPAVTVQSVGDPWPHLDVREGWTLTQKRNKTKQQMNRKQSICWRVRLFWNPWQSVANPAVTGQPGGDWTTRRRLHNPAVTGQSVGDPWPHSDVREGWTFAPNRNKTKQ